MVAGTGTQYLDGLPVGIEQAHTTLHSNQPGPDGIWLRILQEVSAKNNQAIQGSLLILGNERTGKTALVSRLTGGERRLYSSVLEYSYLQIQADADASYAYQLGGGGASGLLGPTDSANLPVWILDGKEEVAPLLKFTFPPNLAKCVVILNASLEQPGNILPALRRWYRLLDEQIRQHYQPEEIVAARQAQVRFWQEYVEPTDSSLHQSSMTLTDATLNGGPGTGSSSDHRPGSPLLLPPEKGILDENCGAALCVVVTKSDLYTELSTEQLDKVQYHVRQFCIRHGAALIYTSAKEDLNTQLLHKYIAHRIYALPFTTPAYIVEKDRIFVPTGWDSEQKLSIVKEALGFGNSEVPMLPQQMHNNPHADPMVSFARTAEREIEAEDEQAFLSRLASMTMDSSGGGGGGGGSSNGQQSPRRGGGGGGEGAGGGGGGGGAKGTGDSNNTMLAFFSSLLTKDNQRPPSTHSPKSGGSPAPSVTSAMSVDAEQHFQKLAKRNAGGGGGPTPPQAQRSASNMSAGGARPKLGGTTAGSPQPAQQQPTTQMMMDEADNSNNNGDGDGEEEFEDAPEGDDESFGSSSMGSTTVTPRSGGGGGGGGAAGGAAGGGGTTTTGSSTEHGPPPDIQQQQPPPTSADEQ